MRWWCSMGVTTLLLMVVMTPLAYSCSCSIRHPQQHVCESDFVLIGRVRRTRSTTVDQSLVYKIRVKKVFKTNEKVNLALSKGLLYSGPGTCSVDLKHRRNYLLVGYVVGGKPTINICNFAKPWKTLAPKMKKGFRLLYQSSCECSILSCHWWDRSCPKSSSHCSWSTQRKPEDCQGRHVVCARQKDGTCDWLGGRQYRSCMKKNKAEEETLHNNREDNNLDWSRHNNVYPPNSKTPVSSDVYRKYLIKQYLKNKYRLNARRGNKIGYLGSKKTE